MPRKIMLDVVRKTKVPTKEQLVNQFRSDWKPIYRISYEESKKLFKNIGEGEIETESQFVNYILNKFGEGIYYFRVYKKGQKGFRDFLYVEIQGNRFRRLKSIKRHEEKKKVQLKHDINVLKSKISNAPFDKKEELSYDLEDKQEELKDIQTTKKTKYPYPYLTSSTPVYSWHGIEEIIDDEDEEEMQRLR